MSSVITEYGGPLRIVYFTEDAIEARSTRLTAAVVWHCGVSSGGGFWGRLIRHLRLDPLNRRFGFGMNSLLWSGSSGRDGGQEALFHVRRRVVRVLGRDYVVPAHGQTLILLVDERPTPPQVVVRIAPQPTVLRGEPASMQSDTQQRGDGSADVATWQAFLRSDPVVATFIAAADREDEQRGNDSVWNSHRT